jgi:cell division protein FtsB
MNAQCPISKIKYIKSELWNHRKAIMTSSILLFAFCFLLLVTGCATPNNKELLAAQIEQLTQENTQLQGQVKQYNSENKELKDQIQVLSALPEGVKLENLNRIKKVDIGRYTGFFDKDKDGKKEKLIVYIQPVDEQGDALKAVGTVEVQLWDLNKTDGEAMLGQWKVEPDELKKLWFATVITSNYRLTFDIADIIDNLQEPLTVKVTFTDYLTGKVFTDQKVIEAP